jgi:hypothetical protein
MAGENLEIRQHPLGQPVVGDFFVYQSMVDLKTKRVPVDQFLPSITSLNIEWTSAKATAGDYDIDVIATKDGDLWQSTVDNNLAVPGTDATWTKLTKGKSGFVMWAPGTFLEDEVFVINIIYSTAHIFRLNPATARPFTSSNFTAELLAGHWQVVGRLECVTIATNVLNTFLDFRNLPILAFEGQHLMNGARNIFFSNDLYAHTLERFVFQATAGITLEFEAGNKRPNYDGRWSVAAGIITWNCPQDGYYIMKASKIMATTEWMINIEGCYDSLPA